MLYFEKGPFFKTDKSYFLYPQSTIDYSFFYSLGQIVWLKLGLIEMHTLHCTVDIIQRTLWCKSPGFNIISMDVQFIPPCHAPPSVASYASKGLFIICVKTNLNIMFIFNNKKITTHILKGNDCILSKDVVLSCQKVPES